MRAVADRPGRNVLVAAALALAVLVLVLLLAREGPDQTGVGRVTRAELHQLCIALDDGQLCAQVDDPASVAEIAVGDCIELRRSFDQVLESARPSEACP